jgi:hypothetical protein
MIRSTTKAMNDTSSTPIQRALDDKKEKPAEKLSTIGLMVNLINDITPNGILPLSAALVTSGLPTLVALVLVAASAAASWWTINILASLQDTYDRQAMAASGPSRAALPSLHSVLLRPRQAWAVDVMLANLCFWCCVT